MENRWSELASLLRKPVAFERLTRLLLPYRWNTGVQVFHTFCLAHLFLEWDTKRRRGPNQSRPGQTSTALVPAVAHVGLFPTGNLK